MAEFVQMQLDWILSNLLESYGALAMGRAIDKTDLDGTYDFTFEFAGGRGPGGAFPPSLPDGQMDTAPNLFDSLRQQLGLTLMEKTAPLDLLVVDRVDKIPTDN